MYPGEGRCSRSIHAQNAQTLGRCIDAIAQADVGEERSMKTLPVFESDADLARANGPDTVLSNNEEYSVFSKWAYRVL